MARNASDALVAFQAAEAALREGEEFLAEALDGAERFTAGGNAGLWTPAAVGEPERWSLPGVWDSAGGGSRAVSNPLELVAAQPRYLVERLATLSTAPSPHLLEESRVPEEKSLAIFRVTARGVGRSENVRAMVQSTFGLLL